MLVLSMEPLEVATHRVYGEKLSQYTPAEFEFILVDRIVRERTFSVPSTI